MMDCGDNSCLFVEAGDRGGMRTNGGCRCLADLNLRGPTGPAAKLIKSWLAAAKAEGARHVADAINTNEGTRELLERVRVEGIHAGLCLAAYLHESVNPACDHERADRVPGAGAMGAVIEYRDLIRAEADIRAAGLTEGWIRTRLAEAMRAAAKEADRG